MSLSSRFHFNFYERLCEKLISCRIQEHVSYMSPVFDMVHQKMYLLARLWLALPSIMSTQSYSLSRCSEVGAAIRQIGWVSGNKGLLRFDLAIDFLLSKYYILPDFKDFEYLGLSRYFKLTLETWYFHLTKCISIYVWLWPFLPPPHTIITCSDSCNIPNII